MNVTIVGRTVTGTLYALLLAVTAPRVGAQQDSVPSYRMRLLGVYDDQSGVPLDGVTVADLLAGMSTVTGKTGTVSLFFLPEGTSVVRLQKLGYEPQTLTVTISPSKTAPLTLLMHRVVQLPTVVTTDAATSHASSLLQGFEERARAQRTGYFIADSILRKNEDRNLADVLRTHAPGVSLNITQGFMYLTQSARCRDGTKAGPPQVYLDGTPLTADFPPPKPGGHPGASSSDQQPFDLSPYSVADLAGIEWYPDASMIPTEFAHPSARCGALFLWTRQR